jgi:hypothetical protein
VAVAVVGCDLGTELSDAGAQLVGAEEDLADARVVPSSFYEARSSRNRWARRSMSRL